jgi:hypothetical protein
MAVAIVGEEAWQKSLIRCHDSPEGFGLSFWSFGDKPTQFCGRPAEMPRTVDFRPVTFPFCYPRAPPFPFATGGANPQFRSQRPAASAPMCHVRVRLTKKKIEKKHTNKTTKTVANEL